MHNRTGGYSEFSKPQVELGNIDHCLLKLLNQKLKLFYENKAFCKRFLLFFFPEHSPVCLVTYCAGIMTHTVHSLHCLYAGTMVEIGGQNWRKAGYVSETWGKHPVTMVTKAILHTDTGDQTKDALMESLCIPAEPTGQPCIRQ